MHESLGYLKIILEMKYYFKCRLDSLTKVDLETDFLYHYSTARRLVSAIEEVRVRKYVSEGVGTR